MVLNPRILDFNLMISQKMCMPECCVLLLNILSVIRYEAPKAPSGITWLTATCMYDVNWATSWQNQQNGMCTLRRLRSAWAFRPVWSEFAVRMKKAWVLSYPLSAQQILWSDWADAQADQSLRWAHSHFVGFVMRQLILINIMHPECVFCWTLIIFVLLVYSLIIGAKFMFLRSFSTFKSAC